MAARKSRKSPPTKQRVTAAKERESKPPPVDALKVELKRRFSKDVVDAIFEQHREARDAELIGAHDELERAVGLMCEAVARLCAEACGINAPTIGDNSFKFDVAVNSCINKVGAPEPYRISIPRLLRAMYDVRSRRGVDHLSTISPNMMDARRLMIEADWIIAELARVTLEIGAEKAQAFVDSVVGLRLPLVENIHGEWRVLSDELSAEEHLLALAFANTGRISKQALLQYATSLTTGTKYRAYEALLHKRFLVEKDGLTQLTATGRAMLLRAAAGLSRKGQNQ